MAGLARRDIRLGTARRAALPGGAGSRSKALRAIYQKPGPLDGHKLRLGTTTSKFNGLHRFAAAHLARVLFFPLLRYFEIAAPTRSQTSFVTKKNGLVPGRSRARQHPYVFVTFCHVARHRERGRYTGLVPGASPTQPSKGMPFWSLFFRERHNRRSERGAALTRRASYAVPSLSPHLTNDRNNNDYLHFSQGKQLCPVNRSQQNHGA